MDKIDFLPSGNCSPSKTIKEGCAGGVSYIAIICDISCEDTTPSISYLNMETGVIEYTKPVDFQLGSCMEALCNAEEVIVGDVKPEVGSVAPTGSKFFYDTTTNTIVSANEDGFWVDYVSPSLNVILTPQPTPTETGNTTNLNSTFKDEDGNTWIVDNNGDAIQAGNVITLDGNNYNVVRADAVAGVEPTATEAEEPIKGDTATVFLSDNKIEYWVYDTAWTLAKTVNPTVLDGNDKHIVRTDNVLGTAPTAVEVPTATLGDTAKVILADKTVEYWSYDGSAWVLDKTIEPLNVLPTVQPTPTATGNTTNLNTVFKDANDDTWVVDSNGDAMLVHENMYASGAVLAAIACVNNVVNVPTGNPTDVKTVGAGGDFADFQTALASGSVVDGTVLKLLNDITTSTTINVNKAVVIDFDGKKVSTTAAAPVTVWNITAGATLKDGVLEHNKTTNTSVETLININSPSAPVYIIDNDIKLQEFGVVARGQYYIGGNKFSYIGASLTNSHRFIMLNGVANESRIYDNEYTASLKQGTTRYTNFIYATSGGTYSGKLFINDNIQTGGDLRQFFLHDSGVPTGMELYVANNTFNDFNGGVGIVGVPVYNGYSKIGIYNNTQGADSAGNYKGLFFVDGTGAINESVVVEYGDNVLGTTALRADYVSYLEDGSSEVAMKNTATFVNKVEKVGLEESLNDLGLLIQELKERKTYIEGASGSGTKEDPYVITPAETQAVTTLMAPVYYNNGWVDANNSSATTVAKLMELSDGTLVDDVDVTYNSHGFNVGDIYYLADTDGNFTNVKPTSGYIQQLFIVKDENTIHIDIEEAYSAEAAPSAEIVTTSITPQVYNGTAYVNAQADADVNVADLLLLSDGTRVHDGKLTWTGHGLTVGSWYYTSQTTAGQVVTPKPTSGLVQQLFFVEDANTIHVDIEEAWNANPIAPPTNPDFAKTVYVNGTDPNTATIFDTTNPPATNNDTLKQDSQNIYFGTDGSTWTWNGTAYTTYVFPQTTLAGVNASNGSALSFPNAASTKISGLATNRNTAGADWNPATGEFTAPRAGWYDVSAVLHFNYDNYVAPNGVPSSVYFTLRGTSYQQQYWQAPSAGSYSMPSQTLSSKVWLNAGQKVWFEVYHDTGSTKTTPAYSFNMSILEVK